jgi:peptidoglycan/xylan/chitin deacetylase (PgdA/CDA1 family)
MERNGGSRCTLGGSIAAGVALAGVAWAARGRSSTVFGPSVWRGSPDRREIALTFDDGPSPSTPNLVRVLEEYKVPATFFQCGMHVRRFPQITRDIAAGGHETGNHTDTHPRLWFKSSKFVLEEMRRTQEAIGETIGVAPRFFRATYGVRWFGVRKAQRQLGLLHIMWTTIGLDWKLGPKQIADRLLAGSGNGAILCLHDGREREADPDIRNTIEAVKRVVPALLEQGYRFRTVSDLLR